MLILLIDLLGTSAVSGVLLLLDVNLLSKDMMKIGIDWSAKY